MMGYIRPHSRNELQPSHSEPPFHHHPQCTTLPKASLNQGKRKHINININKSGGLSRDWSDGKTLFMYFLGSFLMAETKHINKIPGQSREKVVICVFLSSVFLCSQLKVE